MQTKLDERTSKLNHSEIILRENPLETGQVKSSPRFSEKSKKVERSSHSYFSTQKPKRPLAKSKMKLCQSTVNFYTGTDLQESLILQPQKPPTKSEEIKSQIDFSKIKMAQSVKCGMSQGRPKVCQDEALLVDFVVKKKHFWLFAVFDGHGRFGERLSKFVKGKMSKFLQNELKNSKFDIEGVKDALRRTVNLLHSHIVRISSKITSKTYIFFSRKSQLTRSDMTDPANSDLFNAMCCGSTCSLLLMFDDQIVSMSLGDSKTVLFVQNEGKLAPVCLSLDHNASNPKEVERVLKKGGVVQPIQLANGSFVGPDRIWDKELKCCGLQVTRGFGDLIARKYGISGTPGNISDLLT